MHYKTIVLVILHDRPSYYEELRTSKRLLPALEEYAAGLRERHLDWKRSLIQQRPGSDPAVIASEAMELAIEELTSRLPCASNPAEAEGAEPAGRLRASSPPA